VKDLRFVEYNGKEEKMNPVEKDFWVKIQAALHRGESLKIIETERSMAEKLVAKEKCFWSIDYDHVMAYEADQA
jgi:hypothetical protein